MSTVQVLDKFDLTNAQKRDERFYPPDAVIVFNQKVRHAEPGMQRKIGGHRQSRACWSRWMANASRSPTSCSNKITVCLPREISVARGDRLHLKANRKLAAGGRVTNGELVTVKSVRADGGIELADGRVLDKSFPGVSSWLRRHVLRFTGQDGGLRSLFRFHRSRRQPTPSNGMSPFRAVGAASAFSRRTRIQLRENLVRSGHRPLALEFAARIAPAPWQSALGPAAWLSSAFRPARRRHILPAETIVTVTHQTNKNMSTKLPECYTTDPQASCLRVEMPAGASHCCCRWINSRLPNSTVMARSKSSICLRDA